MDFWWQVFFHIFSRKTGLKFVTPKTSENFTTLSTARKVLPALLQKLVGEFFFDFSQGNLENLAGNLEGIFRGFFLTHRTKAQKFRGKFRGIFRKKIRGSEKIFRAKFTLQTCHLKGKRFITWSSLWGRLHVMSCDYSR